VNSRCLELLCCPMCQGVLKLEVLKQAEDVQEGLFTCIMCGRIYPLINGIPRLLPDALAHLVPVYHKEFFRRYGTIMAPFLDRCITRENHDWFAAQCRTVRSYSYQWCKFKEMIPDWEAVFSKSIAPIEPKFFHGKLGLDAGCGFGRSLYYAGSYGAEMIGMDLSESVEAASENTRHLPNVHLIQADIFHLPLRYERHRITSASGIGGYSDLFHRIKLGWRNGRLPVICIKEICESYTQ